MVKGKDQGLKREMITLELGSGKKKLEECWAPKKPSTLKGGGEGEMPGVVGSEVPRQKGVCG